LDTVNLQWVTGDEHGGERFSRGGQRGPRDERHSMRVRLHPAKEEDLMTATVLWIIAAILVIVGIVQLVQGQIILGIVLIVAGCLVGPGGYSIFRSSRA
jgi:hypothetical protein